MNITNILKVASELEVLAEGARQDFKFSMPVVLERRYNCGTVGCIAGWILFHHLDARATYDGEIRGPDGVWLNSEAAAKFLELPFSISRDLFFGYGPGVTDGNISPRAAAAVLRRLAATGEVDWTIARSFAETEAAKAKAKAPAHEPAE